MDASLFIVGAGPAGLMAAWMGAQRPSPGGILVVDRLPVPGAKLAVSGGGRGNLSHRATAEEFAAGFGKQGRFAIPAFRSLPPESLRRLLANAGIQTTVDSAGRIYPRSRSAPGVRDALLAACRKAGVRFLFNHRVQRIAPPVTSGAPWQVDSFTAGSVLLAAGGQSAPRLGSDGSGFALARHLGHDIVLPVPGLTALRTVETWTAALSGLSLTDVAISMADGAPQTARGGMLFTHRGISGPAVLDLSGRISRRLCSCQEVRLQLRLIHDPLDFQDLRRTAGPRLVRSWLCRQVPRGLAEMIMELAAIPGNLTFSRLPGAQEKSLVRHLTALPLTICGTGGFGDSMVTAGGVALKQVRPETLESRLHPRLHFAGEILDLDGPTGGWNLQWAFCSGHLAGMSAAL